jgi:hypothetical protein
MFYESDKDTPIKMRRRKRVIIDSDSESDKDTPIKMRRRKRVIIDSDSESDKDTPIKMKRRKRVIIDSDSESDSDDEQIESQTKNLGQIFIDIVDENHKRNQNDIWKYSSWKNICNLENDAVGKVGETFLQSICEKSGIESSINGTKTKKKGGGYGDGTIKGKTVEIKTARCGKNMSFQHELGETPWKADYMIFIDISPEVMFISIFANFKEADYKSCCSCDPYFPSRKFCWRKKSGCFKFDTTYSLNYKQSLKNESNTFCWYPETKEKSIYNFINNIIV